MNKLLQTDLSDLESLLEKVKKQAADYINKIAVRHTSSNADIPEILKLNTEGLGARDTLKLFKERFEPILVSSSGPGFWDYVTGDFTPASIMGDWLVAIYDQNPLAVHGQGDISAKIKSLLH